MITDLSASVWQCLAIGPTESDTEWHLPPTEAGIILCFQSPLPPPLAERRDDTNTDITKCYKQIRARGEEGRERVIQFIANFTFLMSIHLVKCTDQEAIWEVCKIR